MSAGVPAAGRAANAAKQFCSFRIRGGLCGIDILSVKEISPELNFTPVFHAPEEVRGLINIRGQIHIVIDLGMLLGFEPASVTPVSRIILMKPEEGESFGVLADEIGDVVETDETRVESRQPRSGGQTGAAALKAELVQGVCKLDSELMTIINPAMTLKIIEKESAEKIS